MTNSLENYAEIRANMTNESENQDENKDPFSHWGSLAEELGAELPPDHDQPESDSPEPDSSATISEPPIDPPTPAPESSSIDASAPTETAPTPPQEEEPTGAPPAKPTRSHWSHLASLLGLGAAKSVVDDDEDQPEDEDEPAAESTPLEPSTESAVPAADHDDAPASQHENIFAGFGQQDDAEEEPNSPPSMFADDEQPAEGLLGGFTTDAKDERKQESTNVLSSMFTPTPASFWDEVDSEETEDNGAGSDIEADIEFADATDEVRFESRATSDGEDDGEAKNEKPQGRRRRRRRRRRRGEEVTTESDSVLSDDLGNTPSDSQLRLEASADLFDEHDDDDDDDATPTPAGDSQPDGRRGAKRIPSWLDAVGYVVQRNLDSRSPSEATAAGGRSSSGARRRRGKRRRRPNKQENES